MSTDTRTPAETLRAAAALLRSHAARATPGPWRYCRIDGNGAQPEKAEIFAGPRDAWGYLDGCVAAWVEEDEDGLRMSHEDGDWISTAHPGLGGPLAAWLESAAEDAEQIGPDPHAVAVAKVLLDGPSAVLLIVDGAS